MDARNAVAQQAVSVFIKGAPYQYVVGWPESLFARINAVLPRLVDKALGKQLATIKTTPKLMARPKKVKRALAKHMLCAGETPQLRSYVAGNREEGTSKMARQKDSNPRPLPPENSALSS
ncbi:MAG: hypothetical protein IPK30_03055 [Cellvibrionales bacterium]|nr:hypothetical protein [Cellvibrionales bacterium]